MNEFQRISIYHPPGIAIWESILKGVFQFARPDLPWLIATNTGADVERMRKWEPVGAIVQCASEKEAETFNQLGIPIVNVAREASELWFPSVQIDDVEVGRMAAKYFLERGFESLACYRVNNRDFMTARLEGFSEIASQQGVPVSEFQVTRFQSDQLFLAPDSELVSWLNGLPKPTGLLAATDALGLAVLSACRSADIGIPDDISVLGVSNNELLCHLEYPS
ncbi:MAG: substrate-binding domain-containing protein, partial [Planctomycetota bacterium]